MTVRVLTRWRAGAVALAIVAGGMSAAAPTAAVATPGPGGVAGPAAQASAPSFADVPADHPFLTQITWLASTGISTGYADGTFHPTEAVSRQAMAAFLYRFAGRPAFTPPATSRFSDVGASHPFATEIEWLAAQGISTGYADGTFHPEEAVSRQAMAAFLYRFAGRPAFTPPASPRFSDVATGHPFESEVSWLASTGISTGYADGTFHPLEDVSRQAMAAFLFRDAHRPDPGDATAPASVTGLTVASVSSTTVSLAWASPRDLDFAGVVIRRLVGTVPPVSATEGEPVANLSAAVTSYVDAGLASATDYAYSVFSLDEVPNYSGAAVVVAQTGAALPAVAGLVATDVTTGSLSLSWTSPDDARVVGYMVARAAGPIPPAGVADGDYLGLVTRPSRSLDDWGLAPGSTYSYSVFAADAQGATGPPTTITVTTAVPPPCEPTTVRYDASVAWGTWGGGECGIVYIVDHDLSVPAGRRLTVGEGAVVKLGAAALTVGGELVAQGSDEEPAVLTALSDDSIGGDTLGDGATAARAGAWKDIQVMPGGSLALDRAEVRYAGIWALSPEAFVVRDSVVRDAGGNGISLTDSRTGRGPSPVEISGSLVSGAARSGIRVDVTADATVLVRGNAVEGAAEDAVSVHSGTVSCQLLSGNTGRGNGADLMFVSGRLVESCATWAGPALPLAVGTAPDYPRNQLRVPVGVTFTVGAGTALRSRDGNVVVLGSMVVAGTPEAPSLITSSGDVPGAVQSALTDDEGPMIFALEGAELSLTHAALRYSSIRGTNARTLIVRDSTLLHGGIDVTDRRLSTDSQKPVIEVVRTAVDDGRGIRVSATAEPAAVSLVGVPVVMGNSVTNAVGDAITVHGDALDGSKLTGNSGSGSHSDLITLSGTLTKDLEVSPGGLTLGFGTIESAVLTVAHGATLTAEAGTVIKPSLWASGGKPTGVRIEGSLIASGSALYPVVFTSWRDDAAGGDTNNDAAASVPATGNWSGIQVVAGGSATLNHVELRWASSGLDVSGGGAVTFSGRVYRCGVGITSDGSYVDARGVDWGALTGPAAGQVRGSGVLWAPWVGYSPPVVPNPGPQPVPVDNADHCPAYVAFGLRGSSEPPQGTYQAASGWSPATFEDEASGFGGMNGQVIDAFDSQRGSTAKRVAIQYWALPVPVVDARVAPDQYLSSIYDGVYKLISRAQREAADCPDELFVVAAYSQGALATHLAMRILADRDPALLDRFVGIALVADPGRTLAGAERWWETARVTPTGVELVPPTAAHRATQGVWSDATLFAPDQMGPLPSLAAGRTVALCHEWDVVCATRVGAGIDAHGSYGGVELEALGSLLAEGLP